MKLGEQSYALENPPKIIAHYSVAGPVESKGMLGNFFDLKLDSDEWGEKSHELAECKIHHTAIMKALDMSGLEFKDVNAVMCGDLLNQIIASSYSAKDIEIPYLGFYGACSTFGEMLCVASLMISSGSFKNVTCSTSSHFSTAERQYRYPLELGTQPTPTSQWTVTGSGCSVLSSDGEGPEIFACTIGRVIDLGVKDANNMGAVMAPAACDTICTHLNDLNISPEFYDLIITGDLGKFGSKLLLELARERGFELKDVHSDCGSMIFNNQPQTIQGGSGAGCSSLVFNSYIIKQMKSGNLKKVLLVPTGALLSKTASMQGETIPGIAHAVSIGYRYN